MITWMAMAALAALSVLVVARPWWAARLPQAVRRRTANVAAYRSRLEEIDADVAAGLIDAAAAAALREEQGRRLLASEGGGDADSAAVAPRRRLFAGVLLALLPVAVATGWYVEAGSWRTADEIAKGNAAVPAVEQARVESMVAQLQARLKSKPDDAEGWSLLGRSELVLQQYQASADAYAKANQLTDDSNPDWMVGEGQALALAGGHDLQGRPAQLFDEALKIAPDDPRALWFAGLVAAQGGDRARARSLWQRLADQPSVPKSVHDAIESEIAKLEAPAAATTQDQGSPASRPPVSLKVTVRVAPAVASKLPVGATLFVFAKAANGPPMPLAVQRIAHPQLPLTVTLDDSMAVMPTVHLSDVDAWIVGARLSASGTAQPASGDVQGQIKVSRADAGKPVTVTLDSVVP